MFEKMIAITYSGARGIGMTRSPQNTNTTNMTKINVRTHTSSGAEKILRRIGIPSPLVGVIKKTVSFLLIGYKKCPDQPKIN